MAEQECCSWGWIQPLHSWPALSTACHELGHTVTLSHYATGQPMPPLLNRHDCMRNKRNDNGSWNSHGYEGHYINSHVNVWFCAGCTLAAEGEPR